MNSKFLETLYEQMILWKEKDLITDEQVQNIKTFYKTQEVVWNLRSIWFIQILSLIWAVFLWIWIILFFAANWDNFWDLFKTLLLVFTMLSVYLSGFYLYYINWHYQKTWYSLILLWTIIYWANIFLLGQIYNIWWDFYQAMMWWLIWVAPLAYITWFSALLVLSMWLFYVYLFSHIEHNFTINEWIYPFLIAVISSLFISISNLHKENFKNIYGKIWLLGIFISFFIFTFKDFYIDWLNNWILWILLWILWVSLLIKLYSYIKRLDWDNKVQLLSILNIVVLIVLILKWYFYPESHGYYFDYNQIHNWQFLTDIKIVFMNIYFVFLLIWSIYIWLVRSKSFYINISILFLVIFILAKYFDWFYDMLDRWIFFMAWWVVFILVWFLLENQRKRLLWKIWSNI